MNSFFKKVREYLLKVLFYYGNLNDIIDILLRKSNYFYRKTIIYYCETILNLLQ